MLRKLMKYEFRASARIFAVVYLAILALSLTAGIFTRASEGYDTGNAVEGITMTLYLATGMCFFAAVVITTVVNLRRFYIGVFQDEGYLLHTLPVESWEIIASKLLPAMVWTIATVVVMGLSMVLAVMIGYKVSLLETVTDFFRGLAKLTPAEWAMVIQMGVLALAELASTILRVYAVIALGQTASRHRVGMAVLAWFGLNMVQSWLGMMVGESLFSHVVEMFTVSIMEPHSTPSFLLMIGISLFWSALYWATTQWVIARKLDLE